MTFDIAIIGAGPGGYVAAIRAAQLGAKVALIEKNEVGGVCLNSGCIPTKALIASAHAMRVIKRAKEFGVNISPENISINMNAVIERKNKIVAQLKSGIENLIKGRGITLIKGSAKFLDSGELSVDSQKIDAKNFLIATGSKWVELSNIKTDGKFIVTSDDMLHCTSTPRRLIIIGGGVVGCEFACMMNEFGAKVSVIEATPSILPPVEKILSRTLSKSMISSGIEILVDTKVESAIVNGNEVVLTLSSGEKKTADKVIVAVGRKPFAGEFHPKLALTEKGFVKIDAKFKTNIENVYAIGDITGINMLAHAASAQGIAAIENIFGSGGSYDATSCPSPIFSFPEIGTVGATSKDLDEKNIEYKTGRFAYAANGKALCDGETEGQVIVHADPNGKILGVHIIGADATHLIAEAALAMRHGLTVKELSETIHAHPTLSEIVSEACERVLGNHRSRSKKVRSK